MNELSNLLRSIEELAAAQRSCAAALRDVGGLPDRCYVCGAAPDVTDTDGVSYCDRCRGLVLSEGVR